MTAQQMLPPFCHSEEHSDEKTLPSRMIGMPSWVEGAPLLIGFRERISASDLAHLMGRGVEPTPPQDRTGVARLRYAALSRVFFRHFRATSGPLHPRTLNFCPSFVW